MQTEVTYKASPTLSKFHKDSSFVRGVMGPIGSGKSVAMCWEIFLRALKHPPGSNGVRDVKVAVIRNTYRELTDTTIETWHQWFPKNLGVWKQIDLSHTITELLPDGTTLRLEVLFRALDKPSDIKKLLSLELTFAWINEAREIPKQVLDMLTGRVGRYPSPNTFNASDYSEQLYWSGIIMDTNPPDNDHWWYRLFEENKPDDYVLFKQPSGIASNAENRKNLHPKYYERMQSGKTKEWVDVYVHGHYGFITDGMPVFPEFNYDIHVAQDFIEPVKNIELWVGLDFGRTPAAAFAQNVNGQWRFIDEITTENMGASQFAKELGRKLRKEYRGYAINIYGDPAGEEMTQVDDSTPFLVLYEHGIDCLPAPSQDPTIRREALATQLTSLTAFGRPKAVFSPKCSMLIRGVSGGYKYKRLQIAGEDRYQNKPDKNKFSHVCEAAEYLLVGAGEDVTMIGNNINTKFDEKLQEQIENAA